MTNQLREFRNDLKELFTNSSSVTVLNRVSFLTNKIVGVKKNKPLGNLEDVDKVINELKAKYKVGTFSTYLFHILEYLKVINETDLYNEYDKFKEGSLKDAIKYYEDNRFTDETREQYIPYEKLKEEFNTNLKEFLIKLNQLEQRNKINYTVLNTYTNYILLSLYINQPPIRNDYAKLQIITGKKDIKDSGNYLVINSKKVYVVLNDFKNAKSIGPQVIEFSDINKSLIRNYLSLIKKLYNLKKVNPKFLFNKCQEDGYAPIAEDTILKRLRKISKSIFKVELSVNSFRHIYEIYLQNDDKYKNLTSGERRELHKQLLHSTETALNYNRV